MPTRSATPCKQRGCPGLVYAGDAQCTRGHATRRTHLTPSTRPSSTAQGYGATWRKLRTMILADAPLCADPYDAHEGRPVPASNVDHIIPRSRGGANTRGNLQALCHSCHSRKTAGERGKHFGRRRETYSQSTIPITIVTGPPGAGKTTYVNEHKRWGDLVIDVDTLLTAISGLPWYEKPKALLPFALEARAAILHRLARPSQANAAWFITSEGKRDRLDELATQLGATLVVLDVDPMTCYNRIANDERRSDKAELWRPIIQRWHADYHAPMGRGGG